jgi:hypothetical protein
MAGLLAEVRVWRLQSFWVDQWLRENVAERLGSYVLLAAAVFDGAGGGARVVEAQVMAASTHCLRLGRALQRRFLLLDELGLGFENGETTVVVFLQGPATDSGDDEDEPPVTPDEILNAVHGSSFRSVAVKSHTGPACHRTSHDAQILPLGPTTKESAIVNDDRHTDPALRFAIGRLRPAMRGRVEAELVQERSVLSDRATLSGHLSGSISTVNTNCWPPRDEGLLRGGMERNAERRRTLNRWDSWDEDDDDWDEPDADDTFVLGDLN